MRGTSAVSGDERSELQDAGAHLRTLPPSNSETLLKKPFLAVVLAAGFAATAFAAPAASAASLHSVCDTGCEYSTLQSAIDASATGDTIEVQGDLTVAGTTTVNKDVTITGAPGATLTQTVRAVTVQMSAAGSTLTDLTITSDQPYAAEFVQVGANDVTVSDNTIHGPAQALPMSSWVGNRAVVTQGGINGLTLTDNTIHSLRSGAYLNPNGSGTIEGNTLYNTKGDFLIDNANFTFQDNQSGNTGQRSEWGFVIFANTSPDRYPSLAALSAANNYMTAWDQRTGEKFVAPQSPDDCKNGGWKTFTTPAFTNQGLCIAFTTTG
jgi:hypothetical protein